MTIFVEPTREREKSTETVANSTNLLKLKRRVEKEEREAHLFMVSPSEKLE